MQSKQELEDHYKVADPWGYQKSREDRRRKQFIINALKIVHEGVWCEALDVACGEGWISQDLPATRVYGYEISDSAAARFPERVTRIIDPLEPLKMKVGLVVATGCLYGHYDYKKLLEIITACSTDNILTCNIKAWEVKEISSPSWVVDHGLREVFNMEFPYNEHVQKLRVFEKVRL